MLQHVVMLTFDKSATAAQLDTIIDALRDLPGQVPGLQAIDVHPDAGLAEGNAAIFFHMTFVDEASWRAYTPHPAHVALAQDHILPILKDKTALQYRD